MDGNNWGFYTFRISMDRKIVSSLGCMGECLRNGTITGESREIIKIYDTAQSAKQILVLMISIFIW